MDLDYLDFERPIGELEQKIAELRRVSDNSEVSLSEEVAKLKDRSAALTRSIFSKLTPHQIVQLARHPLRPHASDYIESVFTDFNEMHGDRHFGQGSAVVGGMARLEGQPVMVLGQEKGRSTKQKVARNFGMLKPEGFRKALRLMKLAEKFAMPVITLLDTPGAYPGIGAEQRNQSEAIARNLLEMSQLKVPIVCVVIGEGCSGGALGMGVGDRILMMQYAYYSVISPEGCASILWRSADKAGEAAEAMDITAACLQKHGLIDDIIDEPAGGAHRDCAQAAVNLKTALMETLAYLAKLPIDDLMQKRYDYWLAKGGA